MDTIHTPAKPEKGLLKSLFGGAEVDCEQLFGTLQREAAASAQASSGEISGMCLSSREAKLQRQVGTCCLGDEVAVEETSQQHNSELITV